MPLQKIPAYGTQGTLPSEADSRRAGWASRLTAAVHGDRVAGADCPPQSEGVVDAVSVPQPCGDPRVSRQCHNSSKTRGPHPCTASDCNGPLRTDTAGQGRYRGSSTQHPWTPIDRHGWAWAAYGSEGWGFESRPSRGPSCRRSARSTGLATA